MTNLHPLQACWDLPLASLRADALDTALRLQLFQRLAAPVEPEQLAKALELDATRLDALLALLWSMGLLERRQVRRDGATLWRYCATELAQRYFTEDNDTACGAAWQARLTSLRQFGATIGTLLHGNAASGAASGSGPHWAEAARTHIAQEQRAVTMDVARGILSRLPEFPHVQRMLDLGGGPGGVAIALARENPRLRGVVFELPETAAVAHQAIADAGLAEQLEARGGDLTSDALGEGFDLIWCASVLHFVPDIHETLRCVRAALKPGGVLVCAQAEIPATADAAQRVLSYYLPLLLRGTRCCRPATYARPWRPQASSTSSAWTRSAYRWRQWR
ncbi:class I SAM-dependent methyltransferase [Alkalilimnicola ehrlichii]|uniref:class I SAM-dependent methyltransferase n=1 Tax=Alkalilimnicola ehrlichii TaxID=351052 RepID=UPI001C6E865C|nr:class I SAM-dependent methyltransferase [Alkalilimnicola ehrlichii]